MTATERTHASNSGSISALYSAWSAHRTAIEITNMPDHAIEAAADTETEIVEAMLSLRPADLGELAMKLMVCTDGGVDLVPRTLMQEAENLAREAVSNSQSMKRLRDLENQICELRHMASIADRLLDHWVDEATRMHVSLQKGETVTIEFYREDIDELSFAAKHVLSMATDLRRDFYAAYGGG